VDDEWNTTIRVVQMAVTNVGLTVTDTTNVEKLMANDKDDQRETRKDQDFITEVHDEWMIVSRKYARVGHTIQVKNELLQ
jgi:hypothetical protein